MNEQELRKYISEEFLPDFLSKIPKYIADEIVRIESENARLKAEVERLRKAGDELRDSLPYIVDERLDDKTMRKIMNRWNAAKDGKPTE